MNVVESMKVFVQVVERGSFSAAANVLGMSATMVGKHLRGLEQHFETQLLHRTTRRQSLTSVGNNYYQHCKSVLELIDEGESMVRKDQLLPSGKLRISAPVVFGKYALMPFIDSYMEQYPSAAIDLTLTDRLADVASDDIDVAIRIGTPPDSANIIARALTPYRLVLCASPRYLEINGVPHTPGELAQHQCLTLSPKVLNEWLGDTMWLGTLNARFTSNSSDALRHAALSHMGIILQSYFLMAEDIHNGRLVELLVDHPLPTREINVLYPLQRYKTARLSFFLDALQKAFPT